VRLGEARFGVYLCWVFVETGLVGLLRLAQPGLGGRVALLLLGFAANLLAGWCAWRWVEVPAHRQVMRLFTPERAWGFSGKQGAERLARRG
jgi:peptidoglycan/LPS O-acetylase OafA/YrhL